MVTLGQGDEVSIGHLSAPLDGYEVSIGIGEIIAHETDAWVGVPRAQYSLRGARGLAHAQ